MKELTQKIFKNMSRVLRKTPLRRMKWVSRLHDRIFELLYYSNMVNLKDFTLYVDPRDRTIGKKLSIYGEYEGFIQDLLVSLAVPGSVVIDVGANIGLHTIPLARRVGTDGLVIAFEPDPDNYKLLSRNISVNGLKNVLAHNLALSSESGTTLLYQSLENRGGLSLRKSNVEGLGVQKKPVPVQTVVGDDFFHDMNRPISLVKVDVEGAEPLVLNGLKRTLARNPNAAILFEFWPRYIRSFDVDPLAFLSSLQTDGFHLAIVASATGRIDGMDAREAVTLGESSESPLNFLALRNGMREIVKLK